MEGLEFYNPLDMQEDSSTNEETLQKVVDDFPVEDAEEITSEETSEENLEEFSESLVNATEVENTDDQEVASDVEDGVAGIANYLSENGLIKDVPDDIDLEDFKRDDFLKLMQYNVDLEGKTKFNEGVEFANNKLVNKLDDFTKKVMAYNLDNPNADESDIQSYVSSLMYSEDITKLTPENDAEKIVREYYRSIDWDKPAVDNKVVQLIELDALQSEAKTLKPKLDLKATKIANEKAQHAQAIKDYDLSLQEQLRERVTNTLDTGKLNGVELSKEQAQFLYAATMNDDTPVTIKGKRVEMGFAEALIRNAKYNPKSNMEDLMLGLLVIQGGKTAIEKFYKKQAKTEIAKEFSNTFKFSNNKKKVTHVPKNNEIGTGLKFKI